MPADEEKKFDFPTITSLVGCSQIPGPITCIHAHKKRLFVGTGRGNLYLYEVLTKEDKMDSDKVYCKAELKETKSTPSKTNSIVAIQIDPIFKYVFVLHKDPAYGVCIYDMKTLQLLQQKINMEPATSMVIDKKYDNHRLLITTMKPSIMIYLFKHCERSRINDRRPVMLHEIAPLPTEILHAEFIDKNIVATLKTETGVNTYFLYPCNPAQQNQQRKNQVYSPKNWPSYGKFKTIPKILVLDEDIVLLRSGVDSYKAQHASGEPYLSEKQLKKLDKQKREEEQLTTATSAEESKEGTAKSTPEQQKHDGKQLIHLSYSPIVFEGGEPKDVAMCFPYVAGLFQQEIEVCSVYGTESSKTLDPPPSRMRIKKDINGGVMICSSDKRFYVAVGAGSGGWDMYVLSPPDVKAQITQMTKDLILKAPIHLLFRSMTSDKEREQMNVFMKSLQQVSGYYCLFKARIKDAFKSFAEARTECPLDKRLDVRDILFCFQRNENTGERPIDNYQYPIADYSFLALCPAELFTSYTPNNKHEKKHLDIEFNELVKALGVQAAAAQPIQVNMSKILVQKAMNGLLHFLEKISNPTCDDEEADEQFVIEYATISLLIRKLETDPTAYERIEKIVRGPNKFYAVSVPAAQGRLMKTLTDFGLIRHVSLLYRSLGSKYYLKSLEKLKPDNIEKELFRDKYDSIDDAIDLLGQLSGPELLTPEIKPYLSLVINKAPNKAIRIFTAPRDVKPESRDILDFLSSYPLDIKQQFLHNIIYKEESAVEQYHTEYALALIENLLKIFPRQVLLKQGVIKTKSNNSALLHPFMRLPAGEENGLLGQYRRALLFHLRNSNLFNKDSVLDRLRETALYEELVQLYKKMKRHQDAISTLLFDLRDPIGAEQYCIDVFEEEKAVVSKEGLARKLASTPVQETVYNPYFISYIEAYVKIWQENPSEPLDSMLEFLNCRAGNIDPCKAFDVLPSDLRLRPVEIFLTHSIQQVHHRLRTSELKRSAVKTSNQDTVALHKRATSRRALITANTPCSKCDQLIGDAVFSIFPDMSVVHYKCLLTTGQKGSSEKVTEIHPRSRVNFKKFPIQNF